MARGEMVESGGKGSGGEGDGEKDGGKWRRRREMEEREMEERGDGRGRYLGGLWREVEEKGDGRDVDHSCKIFKSPHRLPFSILEYRRLVNIRKGCQIAPV